VGAAGVAVMDAQHGFELFEDQLHLPAQSVESVEFGGWQEAFGSIGDQQGPGAQRQVQRAGSATLLAGGVAETAAALQDGWLATGDLVRMDEEGFFYILDRKKDMIKSGGMNVYPREVDECLCQHPKVKEACVIGIPQDLRGEKIKAFVVLKEGEQATAAEILEHCRQRMASFKVPRLVEFRRELPKTLVGKVLRRMLLEEELKKVT